MKNEAYVHNLRIAIIEDEGNCFDCINECLHNSKNQLIKMEYNNTILNTELKLFTPEVVFLNTEIRVQDDMEKLLALYESLDEVRLILLGRAHSAALYDQLLKTSVQIYPDWSEENRLCEIIACMAKDIKLRHNAVLGKDNNGFEDIIGSLIHQWKQPLNKLSGLVMNISTAKDFGKLTNEYLNKKLTQADKTIKHMSYTLEAFRRFYASDKMAEEFSVEDIITETIQLAKLGLNTPVRFTVECESKCMVFGYEKEFFQALINIINNAVDQLAIKRIQNPQVHLRVLKKNETCILQVNDNAGGITVEPVESVFFPYNTSKKNKGSGLGLFISKNIIEEKMKGKISAENNDIGAVFTIEIPLDTVNEK